VSPLLTSPNRGYADWQRVENWDTGLLWNIFIPAGNTSHLSPVLDVSRTAYLSGSVDMTVGDMTVGFTWYDDENLDNQLGSRVLNMSSEIADPAQLRIPNLGPYLQIVVHELGSAQYSATLLLWGTNRVHPLEFIPQAPYLVAHSVVALAANATNYTWPSDYYAGPVFVNATSPAGFTFRLEALNGVDTYDTLAVEPTAANLVINQSFVVPPGAWRVGMQNTSGAATNESLRVAYSATGSS
jgi:hypothetical protein